MAKPQKLKKKAVSIATPAAKKVQEPLLRKREKSVQKEDSAETLASKEASKVPQNSFSSSRTSVERASSRSSLLDSEGLPPTLDSGRNSLKKKMSLSALLNAKTSFIAPKSSSFKLGPKTTSSRLGVSSSFIEGRKSFSARLGRRDVSRKFSIVDNKPYIYKLKNPVELIFEKPTTEDNESYSSEDSEEILKLRQPSKTTSIVSNASSSDNSTIESLVNAVTIEPSIQPSESEGDMITRLEALNLLRSIPNLDEISATTSMEQLQDNLKGRKSRITSFRPLGSQEHESSTTVQTTTLQYTSESDEAYGRNESSSLDPSLIKVASSSLESSNDSIDESLENEALWKAPAESVVFESFSEGGFPIGFGASLLLPEESKIDSLKIKDIVEMYLFELIDNVVGRTEVSESFVAVRLDKVKLLEQLEELVADNLSERYRSEYLTLKITEHYLRRNKYTLITPSKNNKMNETQHRRYMSALNDLDFKMGVEKVTQMIHETETEKLKAELEKAQNLDEKLSNRLEEVVRNTILTHGQATERLEACVNSLLSNIRIQRNDISEVRLDLIHKQHQFSYIMERIEEINTISEGLKMHTYLAVEVEAQQLSSNLNTKKAELTKMSNLITNKIHLISHLRCRRKLMARKHRVAKIELLDLQKEFAVLRQKVHKGNLLRNKIFAQINECRRQGGIIHFPLLMKDYDDTLIYLEQKREVIKNLRRRRRKIERKIRNVECSIHIMDSRDRKSVV